MAGLQPPFAMGTAVYPNFDLGLGRRKKGLDANQENYVLGTLGVETLFLLATIGASQANTTAQAFFPLPGRLKVSKIAVFCSAISTVAGTILFNIVVGNAGAYTQGNVAGNDNAGVPPVSWNNVGQPTGSNATYPAGGGGIATNVAQVGQALFAADVPFNVATFPSLTTGTGTGNVSQILVPSNPDAVYGNGSLLTLRATTGVGASITNLVIAAYLEPQPLSPSFPSPAEPAFGIPVPNVDF